MLVARSRTDRKVVVRDASRREVVSLSIDEPSGETVPWSIYPGTVTRRLVHNFGHSITGADIAIASNLPAAAGVSSSSALTVGLTLVMVSLSGIARVSDWRQTITDRLDLAGYIGAIENGSDFAGLQGEHGVGTLGGAQDQTAILCCSPAQLDVFSWMPAQHERTVVWPDDRSFVVGVSGVVAVKTAGHALECYNRAARTIHRLVNAWNRYSGQQVQTLREAFISAAGSEAPQEVPVALVKAVNGAADDNFTELHLTARLDQFFEETFVLVPRAAESLARGDLEAFGAAVDASQLAAERSLGNQIAETIDLQRSARELGADAASAFGAGFGGSVWAMVPSSRAETFISRWRDHYSSAFPTAAKRARFFATVPGMPAFEVVD